MHQVYRQIRQAAATELPVHISGEIGTGKDLLASGGFGHAKGVFTGALDDYPGTYEQATWETVFLDGVSIISEKVQISLLGLWEDRHFYRIRGRRRIRSDVRIIAATNEDLQEAVNRGGFRRDLYYLPELLQIHLPPLRERPAVLSGPGI